MSSQCRGRGGSAKRRGHAGGVSQRSRPLLCSTSFFSRPLPSRIARLATSPRAHRRDGGPRRLPDRVCQRQAPRPAPGRGPRVLALVPSRCVAWQIVPTDRQSRPQQRVSRVSFEIFRPLPAPRGAPPPSALARVRAPAADARRPSSRRPRGALEPDALEPPGAPAFPRRAPRKSDVAAKTPKPPAGDLRERRLTTPPPLDRRASRNPNETKSQASACPARSSAAARAGAARAR